MATPLHAEGEGTKLSSTGMTPDTFAVGSGPRRIAFDGTHIRKNTTLSGSGLWHDPPQ
jgi:hypothetical protein